MLKCIIVEHERSAINVLKLMLQSIAERIHKPILLPADENEFVAKDYEQAKILIEKITPDFILLDLNLGDKNKTGHDLFVDCIIPKLIPVIVVTGENSAGLIRPQYLYYSIPFIEKPVSEDDLLEEIKEITRESNKALVKKRYDLFLNVRETVGSISDNILLKDEHYEHIPLKNIIYIESISIDGRSKCNCYLKGLPSPVLCNEELGKFLKRLRLASINFEKVGKQHIVNRAYHIKKVSNPAGLIMANGQTLPISQRAFDDFIVK